MAARVPLQNAMALPAVPGGGLTAQPPAVRRAPFGDSGVSLGQGVAPPMTTTDPGATTGSFDDGLISSPFFQAPPGGTMDLPPTARPLEPGALVPPSRFGSQMIEPDPPPGRDPNPPPPSAPAPPAWNGAWTNAQIDTWYQQHLGRKANAGDYGFWVGNPNAEQEIANSPEARAYKNSGTGGNYFQPGEPPPGFDRDKWLDPTHTTDKYVAGRLAAAGGSVDQILAALAGKGYTRLDDDKIVDKDGNIIDVFYDSEGQRRPQWTIVGNIHGPSGSGAGGAGGAGGIGGAGANLPAWLTRLFGTGGGSGGSGTGAFGAYLPGGFSDPNADNLSQLLEAATAGLIGSGGQTPFSTGISDQLMKLIQQGGIDPDVSRQIVGARETSALAQQAMLQDARAALAGQGTLSLPGQDQGSTNLAVERTAGQIAPEFAGALRDIYTHALDEKNASFMNALQMATGMSDAQAKNLLAAIGQGTSRQQVLAGIALDTLSLNQDWNKFLASHSLDQARLQYEMENGNIANIIELLKLFLQGADDANAGHT